MSCWLEFCAAHQLHPYVGVRRTHVEVYLRQLEQQAPALANSTLRRRISTLSSWFTWLEDEEINVGNPDARVRRPRRHSRPQPWLDRNELTDLLAVAESAGGYPYALICLLGLNGLRVSEACSPDVEDLGGARYQPTLRIVGKGDKPAEVPLNPGTHEAIDQALDGRTDAGTVTSACHRAGAVFSISARKDSKVRGAIAAIPDDAWMPIPCWVDDGADVAETSYTAFAGTKHEVTCRLIVRRVRPTPGSQLAMDVVFDHHAILTDRDGPLIAVGADHRHHAVVEHVIAASSTTPASRTAALIKRAVHPG